MVTYILKWKNGRSSEIDNLSQSAISYYQNMGVSVTQKQEKVTLNPRSSTYGDDYRDYIRSLTKYDALRIVGGVQERPTDTPNKYIQKSTGVETTQCTTCNLDKFLEERGYSLEDLKRSDNDKFWDIFKPTKYHDLRSNIREREALIEAGVSVDLDLTSAESVNEFKEKLPVYRAEADEIKKQSRQQASPSIEVFRSYTSSPESNSVQTSLFGGNRQLIETEKSITTQEAISRDPLGSFTSIGSGVAIGVGVLALSYLLNKRK